MEWNLFEREVKLVHVREPGTWILISASIIHDELMIVLFLYRSCGSSNHDCNKIMDAMAIPCAKGSVSYNSSQPVVIILFLYSSKMRFGQNDLDV